MRLLAKSRPREQERSALQAVGRPPMAMAAAMKLIKPGKRDMFVIGGLSPRRSLRRRCSPAGAADRQKGVGEKHKEIVTRDKEEVTPPDDQMREHGVLLLFEFATLRPHHPCQDGFVLLQLFSCHFGRRCG